MTCPRCGDEVESYSNFYMIFPYERMQYHAPYYRCQRCLIAWPWTREDHEREAKSESEEGGK